MPPAITTDFAGAACPVGSRVRFDGHGETLCGVVAELHRRRAAVVTEDGQRWKVPYGMLAVLRRADGGECTLAEVAALAEDLLAKHKASGALGAEWRFGFDLAPRRAGVCRYDARRIDLAVSYCLRASAAEIADTILHEIAHAIVGAQHNHDAVWQDTARRIGCTAQRCHRVAHTAARWVGECGCGRRWFRHRLQRRMARSAMCAACDGAIVWRRHRPDAAPGLV